MNINEIADLISSKIEENFTDLQKQYFDEKKKTLTKFFILDNLLPDELVIKVYENLSEENFFDSLNRFKKIETNIFGKSSGSEFTK